MNLAVLIEELRQNYDKPREVKDRGSNFALTTLCTINARPTSAAAIDELDFHLPQSIQTFWTLTSGARLFYDVKYGQWGLDLLSPEVAKFETHAFGRARIEEHRSGDLVIGKFIGDLELLIVRCEANGGDFGSVVVAMPLDTRNDWYTVGRDFEDFLANYVRADGDKFWDRAGKSGGGRSH